LVFDATDGATVSFRLKFKTWSAPLIVMPVELPSISVAFTLIVYVPFAKSDRVYEPSAIVDTTYSPTERWAPESGVPLLVTKPVIL